MESWSSEGSDCEVSKSFCDCARRSMRLEIPSKHRFSMSAQRQKPIDFAAEGLRLALFVDRKCGIRVQSTLIFIEPMYARAAEKLPEGLDWLYEIKLDGYRCLAARDSKGVILRSGKANPFTTHLHGLLRLVNGWSRAPYLMATYSLRRNGSAIV